MGATSMERESNNEQEAQCSTLSDDADLLDDAAGHERTAAPAAVTTSVRAAVEQIGLMAENLRAFLSLRRVR